MRIARSATGSGEAVSDRGPSCRTQPLRGRDIRLRLSKINHPSFAALPVAVIDPRVVDVCIG